MDEDLKNELSAEEQAIVEKVEGAVEGVTEIEDWEFEDSVLRLFSDLNLTFQIDFGNKTLYLNYENNYGVSAPQGDTVEEVANWFRKYAEQMEKEHKKMIELGFEPEKLENENVYNILCLYSKPYRFNQLDELAKDLKKLASLWDELDNDLKKLYPELQYAEGQKEYGYEDQANLEQIVEQLEDQDKQARLNALTVLSGYVFDGLAIESALPKLVKLLDDQDQEIRMTAVYLIGDYATERLTVEPVLPKLVKLLDDQNEEVRGGAAYALGNYASKGLTIKSALPKLAKLAKEDKNEETRDNAAQALDEYAERGLKPT